MADISDVIKGTHEFFNQNKSYVFQIFVDSKTNKIQVYTRGTHRQKIRNPMNEFIEETFPEFQIHCKSLKSLDVYAEHFCQDNMIKNGFSKPDVPNEAFIKIGNFLYSKFSKYGDIYKNVYFYRNLKQLTKIDFILRYKDGFALIAAQEIKGTSFDKNIRRKHKKLRNANEVIKQFYNKQPWLFRAVLEGDMISFFKMFSDGNEKPYPLTKLIQCRKYFS